MGMDKELDALINLLEDNDREVVRIVEESLLDRGMGIVPELEKAWEGSPNELFQQRVENIIQDIQFDAVCNDLEAWKNKGGQDLVEGAWCLARYQYPGLNLERLQQKFKRMANDVKHEMPDHVTPLERIKVLNHIIYDCYHFTRVIDNQFAPQYSLINHVIDTRKGNATVLAVLYLAIAQDQNLPIYGVQLPRNFIVAYTDFHEQGTKALFYINPFNNGAIVSMKEIETFIEQQNLNMKEAYYRPCSNVDTIKSLLDEFMGAYKLLGNSNKVEELKEFYRILSTLCIRL